ncbi:phosphatase PAP2 family protein [Xylophilus sp. Kf1]|nr:phosphatase PAP2 family protein [Xylophilus sp. Kf1]
MGAAGQRRRAGARRCRALGENAAGAHRVPRTAALTGFALNHFDTSLFLWLNAGASPHVALVSFATFMSDIAPSMAGIGLLVTAVVGGPALRRTVVRCLLGMMLSWLVVSMLRRGFPMPRPAALNLGWQWMAHSNSSGFPSHHAAGALACWAGLAISPALRARPAWGLAGLVVALSIAWSRIFLGVHFPRDVVVGAAIGWISAIGVAAVADRLALLLRRRRVLRLRQRRLQAAL